VNRQVVYYENGVRMLAGGVIRRGICTGCGVQHLMVALEEEAADAGTCTLCGESLQLGSSPDGSDIVSPAVARSSTPYGSVQWTPDSQGRHLCRE
jgi:hypothetical protein